MVKFHAKIVKFQSNPVKFQAKVPKFTFEMSSETKSSGFVIVLNLEAAALPDLASSLAFFRSFWGYAPLVIPRFVPGGPLKAHVSRWFHPKKSIN